VPEVFNYIFSLLGYLDFPDQIVFSDSPVRYESTRILLVRNVGDSSAKFDILCDLPFAISPTSGFLEAGKSTQFTVSFYPKVCFYADFQQTGSFQSALKIHYETGEVMLIELVGSAENVNVRLDKSNIRIQNTIFLTASKIVKLTNRSELMVKYGWKRCSNEQEETHLYARRNIDYLKEEQDEIAKWNSSNQKNSTDLSLIKRKYLNKRNEEKEKDLDYKDDVFRIEPSSGTLWPGSSVDINVFFRPSSVGEHNTIAYCEVEGRESRLPLQLKVYKVS
jgi:hydrocephalus-inducing protein